MLRKNPSPKKAVQSLHFWYLRLLVVTRYPQEKRRPGASEGMNYQNSLQKWIHMDTSFKVPCNFSEVADYRSYQDSYICFFSILFSTWTQFSIAVFFEKLEDFRLQILRPYISAQVFPSLPVLCCRPGCRNYSWIQRHAPGDDGMSSAIGPGGKKGRLQTSCGVCVCTLCICICICIRIRICIRICIYAYVCILSWTCYLNTLPIISYRK